MSNTRTIAKNTGWYGIDNVTTQLVNIVTSIAIARYLGPTKQAHIVWVSYIAAVVSSLGSLGIAAATRKYMAEFIGMGDKGTARYLYFRTFRMQLVLASLAAAGIVLWVLYHADAEYRLACSLIALSIWPSMVNAIPAGANTATENLAANLPGSLASTFVYLISIFACVVFHWGVTGVGAALLLMRSVDFLVRLLPTMKRVLQWDRGHALPEGLRSRMLAFAWQSVTTMLLALVVWERFEVLLLGSHKLCADIRQVAYYSIAFSLGNMLLLSSTIFGGAAGTTMFAQFGRDKSKLPQLASAWFRYLTLTSIPLHAVATALAFPALILLYGSRYREAAMVVTIAPLLCMPKAYLGPVQSLLQSNERQVYVIVTMVIAGLVDIGVTWALIPAYGAVGACIGSGAAQITAVGTMWVIGMRLFRLKLPWVLTAKVAFISAVAAFCAHCVAVSMRPLPGILLGGAASIFVLLSLLYALRVLEPEDHERFAVLIGMLPKPVARPCDVLLSLLLHPGRTRNRRRAEMDAHV